MNYRWKRNVVILTTALGGLVLASLSLSDDFMARSLQRIGIAYDPFFARWVQVILGAGLVFGSQILDSSVFDSLNVEATLRQRVESELNEAKSKLENAIIINDRLKARAESTKSAAFDVLHQMLSVHIKERVLDVFEGQMPADVRVTVYSHRRDSDTFSQIARFSGKPLFNKPGRSSYAIDSGSIGEAWQEGSCEVEGLPDPIRAQATYARELISKWNMSEGEVADLTMTSRAMRAEKIWGGASGTEPIGVVLVETTRENLSDRDRRLLEETLGDRDGVLKRVMNYEYQLHKKIAANHDSA